MRRVLAALSLYALLWSSITAAPGENPLSHTFTDWSDHPAIEYSHEPATDPIAELNHKIQAGQVLLSSEGASGYLRSLLKALNVPISSQIAVFAKDSAQGGRIESNNPRTIFFNDTVAIGWVRGGYIEIAAQDPRQAVVFYTIDEGPAGKPYFRRRDDCLTCHYNYATAGVPGMIARSGGHYSVDHSTPVEQRWGGWYVTGRLGSIQHLGNVDPIPREKAPDGADNLNWTSFDRKFDATGYLSRESDTAALMVFEHQMHMMNLLSRIGWEVRVAEHQRSSGRGSLDDAPIPADAAAKEVVDYMLFIDEAPIRSKFEATAFAKQFSALEPRDRKGRSLRLLRLDGRMMEFPCSYMIYSPQFDSLPEEAKNAIYRRLWRILSGQEKGAKYAKLSRTDRLAITEILLDTKKSLPAWFQIASIK